MRIIGFIGVLALLLMAGMGLLIAGSSGDWKGIALMLSLVALSSWAGIVLWRGRQLESAGSGEKLADGWAGESVTDFVRHQMLRSPEGIIVLAGGAMSAAFAVGAVLSPPLMGLSSGRAGAAMVFGTWPVIAFVFYVRVCGPRFVSGVFPVVAMLAVAVAPFWIVYT